MALIKVNNLIVNTDNIAFVNLSDTDVFEQDNPCVTIAFVGGEQLYFQDKDAEIFQWYFNHPTSGVKDLKGLKG